MLDKLKFWKKEDDLDSWTPPRDDDPFKPGELNTSQDAPQNGTPSTMEWGSPQGQQGQDPFSAQESSFDERRSQIAAAPQNQDIQHVTAREVELILAKIDRIISELDSMHQRLRKIEQSTEQKQRMW